MKVKLTPELRDQLITTLSVVDPNGYARLIQMLHSQGARPLTATRNSVEFPPSICRCVRLTKRGNLKGSKDAMGILASFAGKGQDVHELYLLLEEACGGTEVYRTTYMRLVTGHWRCS